MLFLNRAGPRFQIACSVLDAIKAPLAVVDAPIVLAFGFRCGDQSRWQSPAHACRCHESSPSRTVPNRCFAARHQVFRKRWRKKVARRIGGRGRQGVARRLSNDTVDSATPFPLHPTQRVFDADPERSPGDDPARKTERLPPEPAPGFFWRKIRSARGPSDARWKARTAAINLDDRKNVGCSEARLCICGEE